MVDSVDGVVGTSFQMLRALGREEGLRIAVETLAHKLFPRIKATELEPLQNLNEQSLREITAHMLDLPDLHSFRKLLSQQQPKQKP